MKEQAMLLRIEDKIDLSLVQQATLLERVEHVRSCIEKHDTRLSAVERRVQDLEVFNSTTKQTLGWGERFLWAVAPAVFSFFLAVGMFRLKDGGV